MKRKATFWVAPAVALLVLGGGVAVAMQIMRVSETRRAVGIQPASPASEGAARSEARTIPRSICHRSRCT